MPEPITDKDVQFIEKRRRLVRWWNLVGSVMLAGLATFVAWMFWAQPRLINPLHVVGEIEAARLTQSSLEVMAVMLPMAVLLIFLVLAVMIGFAFAMMGNERRYLKVIDQLKAGADNGAGSDPPSD